MSEEFKAQLDAVEAAIQQTRQLIEAAADKALCRRDKAAIAQASRHALELYETLEHWLVVSDELSNLVDNKGAVFGAWGEKEEVC